MGFVVAFVALLQHVLNRDAFTTTSAFVATGSSGASVLQSCVAAALSASDAADRAVMMVSCRCVLVTVGHVVVVASSSSSSSSSFLLQFVCSVLLSRRLVRSVQALADSTAQLCNAVSVPSSVLSGVVNQLAASIATSALASQFHVADDNPLGDLGDPANHTVRAFVRAFVRVCVCCVCLFVSCSRSCLGLNLRGTVSVRASVRGCRRAMNHSGVVGCCLRHRCCHRLFRSRGPGFGLSSCSHIAATTTYQVRVLRARSALPGS